ncbi:helix-turn-helix domain-containing protein [Streptomyces sp. NPDC059352]|uniref:helix-turn-helix domain-containing protein n=1 Tax=Streptomyces sp. NPDC059352 TaxID=3346810 RepID=UPI0036BA110B
MAGTRILGDEDIPEPEGQIMRADGGAECIVGEASPWDRLAGEMRRIKEAKELSYAGLAQRTHYSRSSWERFLNQKQLPTRVAIEQFAAAAGRDPQPLLDQLERCLRDAAAPSPASAVTGPAPAHRPSRPSPFRPSDARSLALVSAAGVLVGSLITVAVARSTAAGGGARRV